jgi:mannosyltransferase
MAKAGKKYGYTVALWELGTTVPTMFRKVSDYKTRRNIPSTNLWNAMIDPSWAPLPLRPLMSWLGSRDAHGDAWNLCHFWSNFEIADMDWFRSKEYRDFFEFLDADGGFYYERVCSTIANLCFLLTQLVGRRTYSFTCCCLVPKTRRITSF